WVPVSRVASAGSLPGNRKAHWITRRRRRRPHSGLAAEMPHLRERGEGSRFAHPLIPARTGTEIAIAASAFANSCPCLSRRVCSPRLLSCKQQEKNRGSKRNAKKINGKSRRQHEKNRQ